jgi:DNA-binding beta-propeller fold protein YncE
MARSRSRLSDDADGIAALELRPHFRARAAVCSRVVRLGLITSFAAGCLLVAAVATAGPTVAYTAYIANFGSGTITPINTATNAASSPPTTINDPSAVAITPDGKTALVANWSEGKVTPVTLSTMTAGSPITVGNNPSGIAITPDGTKAYVSNYHGDTPGGTVTAITLATGATSTISVGRGPYGIAITPNGTMAYVANQFDGTLTPITIATNAAGTPITIGAGGSLATGAVAVSPNGTTVYAANYASDWIVPVTIATNTAGTPITLIALPTAIAITPDGSTAYIAEAGTPGHVVPLTLANNSLGTPITVGANPFAIAITPDQANAYVADYNNNSGTVVTPIALSTPNTAGSPITVGTGPDAVAITPDQAPIASFTVTSGAAGAASSFDASASSVAYGSITNYRWNFGDGTTVASATATITHSYATAGSYTATLTETDTAGTSTGQVFTGQTMSRDGGLSAQTTRTLTINAGTTGSTGSTGSTDSTGTSGSTGPTATPVAPPVMGVKFQAQPHGVVLARTSPGGPLVQLSGPVDLPVGSLINARSGSIGLVMAMSGQRTQTATLWSGTFIVHQGKSGQGMTQFSLAGGSFSRCPRTARAASVHLAMAATSGGHRSVRSLWAQDNHGRFSTRGQNSVATVRGTRWQTIDRCDGTLTVVSKGTVGVRVAGGHRTVLVTAGHSYLAKSRR